MKFLTFPACKECKCFLQVRTLDGKTECAACGSHNLGKRDIRVEDGRLILKERCLFCDKEAGKLCNQRRNQ